MAKGGKKTEIIKEKKYKGEKVDTFRVCTDCAV